tara:strand:+ start:383 stop:844 length:462 start_codon:yes stop_codon:yes gene_type:complete
MKKYYVYKHTDKDKAVYIGMGSNGRAWQVNSRSANHSKFLVKCLHENISSIKIIKYFNNKSDAYRYEAELISYYKPKYNKTWTQAYKDSISSNKGCKGHKLSLETKYKLMMNNPNRRIITYMNKKYNSLSECSRLTKIPLTTLHDRLKNSVRS